jgi:hypothetical protein
MPISNCPNTSYAAALIAFAPHFEQKVPLNSPRFPLPEPFQVGLVWHDYFGLDIVFIERNRTIVFSKRPIFAKVHGSDQRIVIDASKLLLDLQPD